MFIFKINVWSSSFQNTTINTINTNPVCPFSKSMDEHHIFSKSKKRPSLKKHVHFQKQLVNITFSKARTCNYVGDSLTNMRFWKMWVQFCFQIDFLGWAMHRFQLGGGAKKAPPIKNGYSHVQNHIVNIIFSKYN